MLRSRAGEAGIAQLIAVANKNVEHIDKQCMGLLYLEESCEF